MFCVMFLQFMAIGVSGAHGVLAVSRAGSDSRDVTESATAPTLPATETTASGITSIIRYATNSRAQVSSRRGLSQRGGVDRKLLYVLTVKV